MSLIGLDGKNIGVGSKINKLEAQLANIMLANQQLLGMIKQLNSVMEYCNTINLMSFQELGLDVATVEAKMKQMQQDQAGANETEQNVPQEVPVETKKVTLE